MISTNLRILNIQEELEKNWNIFVEYFVKYYGEEKREWIKSQFSKIMLIGHLTPQNEKSYVKKIKQEKTHEIEKKALRRLGCNKERKFYFGNSTFEYYDNNEMTHYYNFFQQLLSGKEGRFNKLLEDGLEHIHQYNPEITKEELAQIAVTKAIPEKYKNEKPWVLNCIHYYTDEENAEKRFRNEFNQSLPLLKRINPNITFENYRNYLSSDEIQEINKIAMIYQDMYQEYQAFLETLAPYEEEIKQIEKIEEETDRKYWKQMILENLRWIPVENRDFIKDYLLTDKQDYKVENYLNKLFGHKLEMNSLLDAFSEEAESILENEKKDKWKKERIYANRKSYWELFGIKEDENSFEMQERKKSCTPSFEDVKKFQERKTELLNKKNIEKFEKYPHNKKVREEIDKRNLLDKEDSFDARMDLLFNGTFTNPNIIKTENGYDILSLLMITGDSPDLLDHNIVHEMNHILELSLKEVREKEYELYSGWDIVKGRINQEETEEINALEKDKEKRNYELFNEIINEIITIEICDKMHQDGIYIFDDQEHTAKAGQTSYERTFFIVKDFYYEFKDKILESRKNGNIDIIWDEVGKDNFDDLNELFHIFYQQFKDHDIRKVLSDRKAGIETEDTKVYQEIEIQRDKILSKMRTHKMLQEEKKDINNEGYHY